MKQLRLSYTKLSFYLDCPFKYYYRYVEKRPYYPSIKTKYGSNIHRAIKDFANVLITGRYLDKKEQLKLIENQWTPVTKDQQEDMSLKSMSAVQLEKFVEKNSKEIASSTLFLEKSFKHNLNDKIILNGFIDRVDTINGNKIEIIDYKSGQEREIYDDNIQLNFYALVCREQFNLEPVKLSLYFLSTNRKFTVEANSENIEDVKELILSTAGLIQEGEFYPVEKSYEHCPECYYKKSCPYARLTTS